jgi:selenocysteine-specific elongation factor
MGTAGHVDHGKTALVRALTGIDCDTHKEEKRRGITINLGFAHMELAGGESVGIVDVPGHGDFVHTMVGGASGIDFVLLVIAADSGVMPQTREHLRIMEILGVRYGLVALTRIDLVEDREYLELVREDIVEFLAGTFLEGSPVVEVSAKTGEGLERLKEEISLLTSGVEERPMEGVFRMYIDRVFSVSGFGTVVTGSVKSGSLREKDNLYLLPGKTMQYQVRRLERHGREVSEVKAGDRASINLAGLDKKDAAKGMILADRVLKETLLADASLELFDFTGVGKSPGLGLWSQVIFHVGTYESQARLHLMNRDTLKPGEMGLVQVHLPGPCVLRHGDRFVIRNSSSDMTLGGGRVIDAAPLFHRRRPAGLVEKLSGLAEGKPAELIAARVRKARRAMTAEEIAAELNTGGAEVERCVQEDSAWPEDIRHIKSNDSLIFFTVRVEEDVNRGILETVESFRHQHPLAGHGVSFNELRGSVKSAKGGAGEELLYYLLRRLSEDGKLVEKDKTWMPAGETGADDVEEALSGHLEFFADVFKQSGLQAPAMSRLNRLAKERQLTERDLKHILYHLTSTGSVYRVKDDYIDAAVVEGGRKKLLEWFSNGHKELTVAEFRDLTGGSRKSAILLLSRYDSEMLTRRMGDARVLIK